MQEIWNAANEHRDVQRSATGYMVFHIWKGATKRAGTRAIALSDNDLVGDVNELYEALQVLLDDIERVKAGYSYIYEGGEQCFVHFYFRCSYYPNPRGVTNWGKNLKAVEKRECFNIFTASQKGVPCAVQVARQIWGPDAPESTIEEIIARASPNVCIVKPHRSVKTHAGIRNFSDLIVELNSPVK